MLLPRFLIEGARRVFEIVTPRTVEEALSVLLIDPERSMVYAGGTELVLAIKQGLIDPGTLVDIKKIPALGGIRETDEGALEIGAAVTHRGVIASEIVRDHNPFLAEVEARVGNVRVRQVGTMVGNLCFAEPHSDVAVLAVLLGCSVQIAGLEGRSVAVDQFLVDSYLTQLGPTEIVETLIIPKPSITAAFGYARVKGAERPLVAAGVSLDIQEGVVSAASVVIGAAAVTPYRSHEVGRILRGVPVAQLGDVLPAAAEVIANSIDAIDDYEASAEYRRHLSAEMFLRATACAVGRTEVN